MECPRCKSKELCIDNVDGYTCMDCGAWFDLDEDTGKTVWAYDHKPNEI